MGELGKTTDEALRAQLLIEAAHVRLLDPDPGVGDLVAAYLAAGVFSRGSLLDARHVAYAVRAGAPVLASWNFKHMVSRTRRLRVNAVNAQRGWPPIEILSPPEL